MKRNDTSWTDPGTIPLGDLKEETLRNISKKLPCCLGYSKPSAQLWIRIQSESNPKLLKAPMNIQPCVSEILHSVSAIAQGRSSDSPMTLSEPNRQKQRGQSKQNHMGYFHLSLLQVDNQDIVSSLQKIKDKMMTHIPCINVSNKLASRIYLLLQVLQII